MGSRIRLIYQGLVLDLNDKVTYFVETGFIPPAVQKAVNYAQGSIINQRGGKRINEKAMDRDWSFSVRVEGGSLQETHQAVRQIQSFINLADDTRNKVYVEYYPSDAVPYKPTWGQQGYYYQVKAGTVTSWDEYAAWSADHVLKCAVNLTIAPYAEGIRQQLSEATGGILEDTLGAADGFSRGLAICEATTNIFTNPVFSHATYNNGWTTDADLTVFRNTDPKYILFDRASAQLVCTAATNKLFYQHLNCGNTNTWCLSFYCKKSDKSAVTASDVKAYYNAALSTIYESVGNGWYMCYAVVTGINSATHTGVELQTVGLTVYVDGFQMEEKTYPTRLAYGDMLGCNWSSTRHASTSVRAAARCMVPGEAISNSGQWTLTYRAVVKFHNSNTAIGSDRYILGSSGISLYFRGSDDKIVAAQGGTVAASSAQTFLSGTVYVIHLVIDKGTLTIYLNGAANGTNTGFTGGAAPYDIYLGSTTAPDSQGNCTFLDFTTWEIPLTAAQIANDYADIYQHVSNDYADSGQLSTVGSYGKRLNSIPYFWNPDGDMVFDHYYDASHEDWAVIGGIPGSGPAKSVMRIGAGASTSAFAISNHTADIPLNMTATFEDEGGTGDAAALGGQVNRISIDTAGGDFNALGISYDYEVKRYAGKQAHIFVVLKDSRTDLMGRMYARLASGPAVGYGDYKTLATTAALRHYILGPVVTPEFPVENDWVTEGTSLAYGYFLKHAGGTANVDADYYRVLIGDLTYIIGSGIACSEIVIDSDWNVWEYVSAGSNLAQRSQYQGNQFRLHPGEYNHLVMLHALIGEADDLTKSISITAVYVTPIYDLL